MNREHGYTLIETLVTMVVVVILTPAGCTAGRAGNGSSACGKPPVRSATTWCCYAMTPTGTTAIEC